MIKILDSVRKVVFAAALFNPLNESYEKKLEFLSTNSEITRIAENRRVNILELIKNMSDSRSENSENTVAVVAHPEVNNYQEKTKKSTILKDEVGHPFRLIFGLRTTEEKHREKEAKKQIKEKQRPGSSHDMSFDKHGNVHSDYQHKKMQKVDQHGRVIPPTGASDIFHPRNRPAVDSAGIPLDPMRDRYNQPGPDYVWSKHLHKWIYNEKGAKKKIDPMANPRKSPGKDYQWNPYNYRWQKIPKRKSSAPQFALPKKIFCSYFEMWVDKSSHSKQCPCRIMYG